MAYDEFIADRIRLCLQSLSTEYSEKNMMGGKLFMVDDKMLCGTHIDKKLGHSLLMLRLGEDGVADGLKHPEALPMDFTGRPMKGFLFVKPDGFDLDDDLHMWIQKALAYNPFAKSSKRKKK